MSRLVIEMTPKRLLRIGLGYLALIWAQVGGWALFAPRSFYDGYPGLGRTWVAVDGPYNEHLVRDVGALNLALVVVLVAAAISLQRSLVVTAALAALVWGVPHTLYHLLNRGDLTTSDYALSVGGLAVLSVVPLAILLTSGRSSPTPERAAASAIDGRETPADAR